MEGLEAGKNRGQEAVQSLGFLVGLSACVIAAMLFAAAALDHTTRSRQSQSVVRLNPNDASVASLARLPGVGATRARAIAEYRDRLRAQEACATVFRCPEDLAQVKGIGPATVEAMRPWLQFDPPTDGNDLAERRGGESRLQGRT